MEDMCIYVYWVLWIIYRIHHLFVFAVSWLETLHLPVSYVISRLWLKRSGLINDFATEELCKRRSVCADLAWIFGKLRRLWRFGRRHATGWLCCRSCSHCLVALGAMHWWTKHAAHSRTNRSCSESSLNERFQGKVPGIALVHHHGLFLRLHVESGAVFFRWVAPMIPQSFHQWSQQVISAATSRGKDNGLQLWPILHLVGSLGSSYLPWNIRAGASMELTKYIHWSAWAHHISWQTTWFIRILNIWRANVGKDLPPNVRCLCVGSKGNVISEASAARLNLRKRPNCSAWQDEARAGYHRLACTFVTALL